MAYGWDVFTQAVSSECQPMPDAVPVISLHTTRPIQRYRSGNRCSEATMPLSTNLGPSTRVISCASKRDRTKPTWLIFLVCLLIVVAAEPLPLAAQITSIIQGTVTDQQHLALVGAEIKINSPILPGGIELTSDSRGSYRILGLQPGTYSVEVAKPGFAVKRYDGVTVTVNRLLILDVVLAISTAQAVITVSDNPSPLETTISSSGETILPQQIEQMPINGRNYLDLMQLVPGVTINRQADVGSDAATPMLGERGGNAVFLIDGMPNSDAVDGGSAAPFDQDSILEFQVLTSGYSAEFGHGSGGVVNVVSKGGTSQWHGLLSAFHRNSALDSSDVSGTSAPFLLRWDPSANVGGPILHDRIFFFGSVERIHESRQLNFVFPPNTPDFLQAREKTFDKDNQTFETRSFFKFDEHLGRHHVTEQVNLINAHVTNFLPLSEAVNLPSTRTDSDSRYLMWGFHDTAILGKLSDPWLLSAYLQYRGEPFAERAAHPEASLPTTLFNMFSGLSTGGLFGDLGQIKFGGGFTPLLLQPSYFSTGAHVDKIVHSHEIKFGGEFQHAHVDGVESANLLNQLFATTSDFQQFGSVNSGVYVLTAVAGPTPSDDLIRLRNNYDGLFVQDDWKIAKTLTLNLGVRWDYDSRFPNPRNFSPRLGVAWSPNPRTVVRASWGVFYDNFRIGLARDIPAFGGANLFSDQTVSFPRLFYGDPSILPRLFGLCASPVLTDAQIAASGATCPTPGLPFFGIDHLNSVGPTPIPLNSVVSQGNVQALSGLTAQQFADAASAAVDQQPGFFFWGGLGNLTMNFPVPKDFLIPVTVDPGFKTPYTRSFRLGIQREIGNKTVVQADYYHRDIRNMLGVRTTNLAFEARMPGHTGELQPGTSSTPIESYGPWYQGRYDGISVGVRKAMSKRFTSEVFYTWANAIDDALHSSFVSEVQTGLGAGALAAQGPTDNFVGIPTLVTDPVSGKTNANGSFIASNGNPVPQAGKFYSGPSLDRGPSDLALTHTLLLDGTVLLPSKFEISGIFRAQSGFHFSDVPQLLTDADGGGHYNGVDFLLGRNHFQAPPYANVDARFSRRFTIGERVRLQAIFEFFNLLNRANPAAVEQYQNVSSTPLGKPVQFLPGREGQVGLRIEFQ
jgi:outer membrane receptor protein involved in Fe transport